jgi:hypothetical protein
VIGNETHVTFSFCVDLPQSVKILQITVTLSSTQMSNRTRKTVIIITLSIMFSPFDYEDER